MQYNEDPASSGWLLNPVQITTALPDSVNQSQQRGLLSSGLQQAASSILLNVFVGSTDNQSTITFDRWFFTSSESSSDVYVLAAFLLFLFLCLILTLPVFLLICKRSRTATNVILFHYFLSNWIFLLAQLIRFIRAQQSKPGDCPRVGQMGPWFYMDVLSTPISYISLALLAVERFAFHAGSTSPPLRWIRSPTILTMTLLFCWLLLAVLDVGLFLLVRMLSISNLLRPVAATLAGGKAELTSSCANPLAGAILSPVRDILTALFVCAVAVPAIGSVLMQICLHCVTCPNRRQFQRSSFLAFGIIFSHLAFALPHVTLGIFTPSNYRAMAWLLTMRAFQSTLAIMLFLLLDQASYALLLSYLLNRKPPPLSSTLNTVGDIDTLIASVDVTPKSVLPSTQIDSDAQIAQHPYLAIRPARLYFERPQSASNMNNSVQGRSTHRSHLRTVSHQSSPVSFPHHGISPRPPPLPPRRWTPRQRGASGGNSRSLPPTRRRLSRRHESHSDLGPRRAGSSTAASSEPHRPAHRLYQSDYRLSLCDERMITIDSRSSPGGWFECVITNEEEV